MIKALLANKYEVDLHSEAQASTAAVRFDTPYHAFLTNPRHRSDIAKEMWCVETLCRDYIRSVESTVEYFGGMGLLSRIIQAELRPSAHTIFDIDDLCLENCRLQAPGAQVQWGDFHQVAGSAKCELAWMDFNTFSLHTIHTDTRLKNSTLRALAACESAVITDSAISRLHLNGATYARIAGRPVDNLATYAQALAAYLQMEAHAVAFFHAAAFVYLKRSPRSGPLTIIRAPKEANQWFRLLPGA